MVLRATKKVLKSLPVSSDEAGPSETALGDWYVNRIVVDRKPLLLLVSAESFLLMLTPARDVKNLPKRIAGMVEDRLHRLGVNENLIRAEVGAMETVEVGPTQDRSVTGQMVNFARSVPFCLPECEWDESDLRYVESKLSEMPCGVSSSHHEAMFPYRAAARLLQEKWGESGPGD